MEQNTLKQRVAEAALAYVEEGKVIGVGTGSTVRFFIDALAKMKEHILGAVASSEDTHQRLIAHGIRVFDLNEVEDLPVYIDGADEITPEMHMIKGGGAALTREKIIAAAAKKFVCIVDQTKVVDYLGRFALPIEVIPMARAQIMRQLATFGGTPVLRPNVVTDNGNLIIDLKGLRILDPEDLETRLNQITDVVCNGLFAHRPADIALIGSEAGVRTL